MEGLKEILTVMGGCAIGAVVGRDLSAFPCLVIAVVCFFSLIAIKERKALKRLGRNIRRLLSE